MSPITAVVILTVGYSFSFVKGKNVSSQHLIELWTFNGTQQIIDADEFLPEVTVSSSDVTLYLYTRNNPNSSVRFALDATSVATSATFSSSRKNVFIIHGWGNNKDSPVNTYLRSAYLSALDVNVFIVDWGELAASTWYPKSVSSVQQVGAFLGSFIGDLQGRLGLSASDFILVGHSLGAHVAGCAGAATNGKVSVIIGMDPAGPLFCTRRTDMRLDPSDAHFVQVIHTNTDLLGFPGSAGHADIRPNGGGMQPACGYDVKGSCSHSMVYKYVAESIISGGFTAWRCDSYISFKNGRCKNAASTKLGGAIIDTSASGDYYLDTNPSPPYSKG